MLNDVNNPITINEYEEAVGKLEKYFEITKDKEFSTIRTNYQIQLAEYRNIHDVLIIATGLYERGMYREAFDKLEAASEKYPKNEKIQYALNSYQYAYVLAIASQIVDLGAKNDYETAVTILNIAIKNYDCQEFQDLLHEARKKSDFWYALQENLNGAGNYIFKSAKKLVLGDFAEEEQNTLLSLGGSVVMSVTNTDAALDIRDLAYDMSHWGEGEYFAARIALDAIGILPIIGAIKYVKHIDKAEDAAKVVSMSANAADNVNDAAKYAKQAIEIADILKKGNKILDSTDVIKDIRKNADTVGDLSDVAKRVEKAKDGANIANSIVQYERIETKNAALLGIKHPKSGVLYVLSEIALSDGRYIKGVFPKFDSFLDVKLPQEYYKSTFGKQKFYLMEYLNGMMSDASGMKNLKKIFDEDELKLIANGILPDRFVWHHNEQEGLMQLVDAEIHAISNHTGGMSIWGAGY